MFALVNVLGLAIGTSTFILIINYISVEFSFDKFHTKKDRIYRVESQFYEGDVLTDDWGTSSFGYGSAISKEMLGIDDFVRIGIHRTEQTLSYQGESSFINGVAFTEPSFFRIFDFKLKEGAIADQLTRPNTVVITEEMARRFFKGEDPIGKVLTFANRSSFQDYEVTGVLENFPMNSHIHFNFLVSYASLPNYIKETWYLHEAYTYLLLSPGKDPNEIEDQFPLMAEKYKTGDALKNKKWAISLVPVEKIHLNAQKQYEHETKGNRKSLITLVFIAVIIMLAAWINYINLNTAISMERAKDVGVRKVAGAFRFQLIRQYMMESWLINFLALTLAVFLILLLKPLFNQLTGYNIGFVVFKQPVFWMSSFFVLAIGIILSGFYPAFIMSGTKPARILKGSYYNSGIGGVTRQVLVVFQFAAALFLICGTFIIYKQIKFMEGQNLGVNIDRTIVFRFPTKRENLYNQVNSFSESLKNESEIKFVIVTNAVPGVEVASFASNHLFNDGQKRNRLYEMLSVDYNFIDAFNFELLAGRSFKKGFGNEHENLLINESALQALGFTNSQDAIEKLVRLEGQSDPVKIIGVVKNWHQRGLSHSYTPIMFVLNGRLGWVPPKYVAIKVNGNNYKSAISLIQHRWRSYFPESSFDYFFLDSFFDSQYKAERRFGKIVGIFTGIALFIAILGLWALTAFTASKKVKEVGVRKVLGAKTGNIVYLFSREMIILVAIALFIATPLSFLAMKSWLMNYAFRTEIAFWIYLAGGLITALIAIVTIGWQSWKAAEKNPVEALRYE